MVDVHQNIGKKVYAKTLTHLTGSVQKKLAVIVIDKVPSRIHPYRPVSPCNAPIN